LALAERFEAGVTLVRAVIPAALGTGRWPSALVATPQDRGQTLNTG
jgi:hypothetical protein